MVYLHRAYEFRPAFAEVGELRSIILHTVPVMPLKATITQAVFQAVVSRLSLKAKDIVLVVLPPQRCNITYLVRLLQPLYEFATELCEGIKQL